MSHDPAHKMALAILAAGQSRRFGEQDKLASQLGGMMLGLHAATALSDASFDHKYIVTSADHPCADGWSDLGYDILINNQAQDGQATSVQMAAHHASHVGARSLCIILADMPFIDAAHIGQLIEKFDRLGGNEIVASSDGEQPMPPAIFPAHDFGLLTALEGDQGARKLLKHAKLVNVTEPILMDIDSHDDIAEAENIIFNNQLVKE